MKRIAITLACAFSLAFVGVVGCDQKSNDAPAQKKDDKGGDKDKGPKDKDKDKDKGDDDDDKGKTTDKDMPPPATSDSTVASTASSGDDDSNADPAAASVPVPSDYAEAAQTTIQTQDDYKKRLDELDKEITSE